MKIFLVGNKLDLAEQGKRAVTSKEAQAFAAEHDLTYFETSARTGTNIEALFVKVARQCLELKREHDKYSETSFDAPPITSFQEVPLEPSSASYWCRLQFCGSTSPGREDENELISGKEKSRGCVLF
jgi:GTPase SAR1 family protein